jgi:hypothetical protein
MTTGRPDFAINAAWLARIGEASRAVGAVAPERVASLGLWRDTAVMRRLLGAEGTIALHEWRTSDPREMHDHPWDNCSIVLAGGFWEITPDGRFWRPTGSVIFRRAEEPHRIELDPAEPAPVTLFITGQQRRVHGWHTENGWIASRAYGQPTEIV